MDRLDELRRLRRRVDDELRRVESVRLALEGKLSRELYIRYLLNVAHQYAPHSPRVMALAASRCTESHPEISVYLLHHAAEEHPHNHWAEQDLHDLKVNPETIRAARPVPSCSAMIGYSYFLGSFANPVALFGWMYVLEAVGSDLGSMAADGVRRALGLTGDTALRFVAGHGAADRGHTDEMEGKLRAHLTEKQDWDDVLHAASVAGDLYVRMFREAAELPPL
jgi:heme oxygenase